MLARAIRHLTRPAVAVPLVALTVAAVELAVADRKYGLFSGGFGMSSAVDTPAELTLFLLGFGIVQTAVVLLAWKVASRFARRTGARGTTVHFVFLYGGISLLVLTLRYQLHSYFSDAVSFALLKQLGGGSAADALLFAKNEILLGLLALTLFLLVWWGAVRLLPRISGPGEPPSAGRPQWRSVALVWLLFGAATMAIPRLGGDGAKGLQRIVAWQVASEAFAGATDFDGDGYGLAGALPDSHPFDGSRHPLALDIPGNGIDEDGFGGDLELVPVPHALPDTPIVGARPHVILVVFESTRADVLGKRIGGRLVAPHLAAVAAQGSALAPAYSPVGFTTESLKSIFTGRLTATPGNPSLFREFDESGYGISVFSGQPEDFGGISETVGMRATADNFVDAETLKDQRAFGFAAQGSLLVDEKVVLDEFDRLLGRKAAWRNPQFVYLNFQSPHFPYDHEGVPERFAKPPLSRSAISEANRDRVALTYWNAVAHADAALGRLVARLESTGAWDDTVLLVTGDHGEALFEDGFLGHGHVIGERQNATFLVSNRRIEGVSPPISLTDYRAILHHMLDADVPPPPQADPFMHIGPLDAPTAIGLAERGSGVVSLRLDRGEACFGKDGDCAPYARLQGRRKDRIDRLVARWGSERWAARGARR